MAARAEGHGQSCHAGQLTTSTGRGLSAALMLREGEAGKARQGCVYMEPSVILFYTFVYSKSFNITALYKAKLCQQELASLTVLYSHRF